MIFGLYEIVTDCFLHINDNFETIVQLKYILSSRYELFICNLSLSDMFVINKIDNTNCHKWSLANKYNLSKHLSTTFDPIMVTHVCPSYGNYNWDIEQEKKWILFCSHWILYFVSTEESKYDTLLNSFLKLDDLESGIITKKTKESILNLLYFGTDIDKTEAKIKNLLNGLPLSSFQTIKINVAKNAL